MKFIDNHIFDSHADFCKTLANPKRLKILALLAIQEMNVGEIAKVIGASLSNISQHLSVLKTRNILISRKCAQSVYYSLADRRLIEACNLIRSVLLDDMKRRGLVARDIDAENIVVID